MTETLDRASIQHRVPHTAKLEGCLVWPDGKAMTRFQLASRVRLYEKDALAGIVQQCWVSERPVAFRDVEECGAPFLAETTSDASTGYFFFDESDPDHTAAGAAVDAFMQVAAWPTVASRYYLAIEGCVVCTPLVATIKNGALERLKKSEANQYVVDPVRCGCLLELELVEERPGGVPALLWKLEVAASRVRGGAVHAERVMQDARWSPVIWPAALKCSHAS